MNIRLRCRAGLAFSVLLFALAARVAYAVTVSAFLSGTVTNQGAPAANVPVTASGNNLTLRTTTDANGHFTFPSLQQGTYEVSAGSAGLKDTVRVDLGSSGATVALALTRLREIGKVAVVRSAPLRGSGSDVTLNSTALTRAPNNNSFPQMLIQLPGAVRGANGVVHINGDHGVIDYLIDGVALPQALNRDIGSELNLNDIAFADVIEGAYPAQYGLKFGSVLNLATRSGTGPAGFDSNASLGSYTDFNGTLGYHAPLGRGGGMSFALSNRRSTRGLDPPNFGSPHNDASLSSQFARFTIPARKNDFTNITLIHSYGTFAIPNDVDGGEPANTNDNETQEDTFLSVQYRHALGDTGAISFGPALKTSRIRDFGDPLNDFRYGEAINLGNGGASTDCANALSSGSYGVTTCGFSLADDRTATDYILQGDYSQRLGGCRAFARGPTAAGSAGGRTRGCAERNSLGRHTIRAGVSWDGTKVDKSYAVTLQPGNFLAPTVTPGTPNGPVTVVDNSRNIGSTYASYLQDSWRLSDDYELDYGLRYDFFTIKSTDFAQGFAGFSPRLKLTRFFGARASIYAYLGRFFEPFSFENVDPIAAQELNLPLQSSVAQFDLKPERDTQLELGGHIPLGTGSLGFRVWQKNANDLIDDTQVGVTLLHQDINYVLGRLSQEALNYVQPLARNGRAYFSIAHTVSLNKGCETQLLAPCFGSSTDFTPADHDQTYSVASGVLRNDLHGGWFSLDGEYGSGLSSGICPPGTPGFCKRTPHTIFNLEKGVGIAPGVALTFEVQNVLDDRYFVTILNAQGNHYAPGRTFYTGLRFGE